MVEMRDGVGLATDVYLAPGSFGAPKPVILIRTPYGKNEMDTYRLFYSTQDYHLVIQDLRGTHDSEGGSNFLLFTKSYRDGVDTLDWILDQSWCNGKIASSGPSALCLNQYYYAGMAPEGLVAQQLWFGTPEMFSFGNSKCCSEILMMIFYTGITIPAINFSNQFQTKWKSYRAAKK